MLRQIFRVSSVVATTMLAAGFLLDIAIGTVGTIERVRASGAITQQQTAASGLQAAFGAGDHRGDSRQ